ncbi:MAG: nickel insertion protein, partial [Candidatus Nanopelagicaceae bacterium]
TSIGYRSQSVLKTSLERFFTSVQVRQSQISIKISTLDKKIIQVSPEFEDAYSLASSLDVPTRIILEEARVAAALAGLTYGATFNG